MKIGKWILLASLLTAVIFSSCQSLPFGQNVEALAPQTSEVKSGVIEITVTSSGNVTLPRVTKLGFSGAVSGSQAGNTVLTELNVAMGSRVTKDQVIARLDTAIQERDLLRYKNSLDIALLNLEKAKQPYKPEDIAKQEAAVLSARAGLNSAREALKKARQPYTENDFTKAEGAVRNAGVALINAVADLSNAEQSLENVTKTQSLAVKDAMENVFRVQKLTGTNQATEYDVYKANESLNIARSQAETALATARNSLATARNNVAKARDTLADAEFTLNDMLSKKNGDPVEIAQREASVVSAEATISDKENTLVLMKAGPDAVDIKTAELRVDAARLAVEDAQTQLDKSTIIAPFDGIIGDFKAKVGDAIQPGSFSIPLVDPSQARVDAYIEEFDVMRVQKGMPAKITLDAFQGQIFSGKVEAISPLSTVQSGVVRYAVTINVDMAEGSQPPARTQSTTRPTQGNTGARVGNTSSGTTGTQRASQPANVELKDGMSATASIVITSKDNVLLVPNRAVISQSGQKKVQVLNNDGSMTDRAVTTGLSNDQFTEIMQGVQEGEKVVIQAVVARQTTAPGGGGIRIPGLR